MPKPANAASGVLNRHKARKPPQGLILFEVREFAYDDPTA